MRAYIMAKRIDALVFAVGVATLGCGSNRSEETELRTSALRSFPENIIAPAYFNTGTQSWTDIRNATFGGYAIANFASGPDSALDADSLIWVQTMQGHTPKTKVLGYVDNLVSRWIGDVVLDIRRWNEWYQVDGIFFDDSQRESTEMTDDDVARNQGLQQIVAEIMGSTKAVIFNWGSNPTGQERYVWCGQPGSIPNWATASPIFVTFEGPQKNQLVKDCNGIPTCTTTANCNPGFTCNAGQCQTTYSGYEDASFASWVFSYPATTFANLVYAADPGGANLSGGGSVVGDFPRARSAANAGYVYMTDGGYVDTSGCSTHRWAALAGDNAISTAQWFSNEIAVVGTYSDYSDQPARATYTCPLNGPQPYPGWMYSALALPTL